uniref:Keratinocyte differentiation associated protein n=1 Tax=Cricetulus griseus TaxID=10029 RepID=A0A8C2LMQ2_CRIGR
MKIPILPAVALLSLLALHAVHGAALGGAEEEATISNYAAGSEVKGLRSAVPDSQ